MKKVLGIALVMLISQIFLSAIPMQTYAGEKTVTDINALKQELEEEKESLVELNDELEAIAEQEKESNERIDYLKTVVKDLESALQKGSKPKASVQEELSSAKEELNAEIFGQEELKDEMDAVKELKKETEDRIAELTAQIQKAESTTVARPQSGHPTETSQQTPVDTSKAPAASTTKQPEPTLKELQEQLLSAKEVLEGEISSLDDIEDQIQILQDEIQEMEEQRKDTEASIHELLVRIAELESAIASIEATEKTPSSAETKSSDVPSGKK